MFIRPRPLVQAGVCGAITRFILAQRAKLIVSPATPPGGSHRNSAKAFLQCRSSAWSQQSNRPRTDVDRMVGVLATP
jgi:hypothetical protein